MKPYDIPQPGTLEHTELLWSLLPHHDQSVVWYFARKDGRNVGDFARTASELHVAATEYSNDGFNVYIQMNPTRRINGVRSSAKDITKWSWLLLDVDPVEDEFNYRHALDTYMEGMQTHVGAVLDPTIVYSGRGVQAWIRLEDIWFDDDDPAVPDNGFYLNPSDGKILTMKRRVARLAMANALRAVAKTYGTVAGCRLDTSVSDLPRVMRMPGTANQKTGRMSLITRVGGPNIPVAKWLVDATPAKAFEIVEIDPIEGGIPWQGAVSRLTLTAANFIRYGTEEPGRHRTVWQTLMSLRDHGVLEDEARKAVNWGNNATHPPLADDELEKIVLQVYE